MMSKENGAVNAPRNSKPRLAVHKFSSCDGCQLALLNAGPDLLLLADLVDIVHFVEAGPIADDAAVDIALVEGSISTPEEVERIKRVRANSRYLVTIGACATAGGIQALRNYANAGEWVGAIYAEPRYISSLAKVTPVAAQVRVDFELWGCPVSTAQVLAVVRSLLFGVSPVDHGESVCLACKRAGNVCVLVSNGTPCMGPVTRTGCGAICPHFGRDCYGCYGPAENANGPSLARRFAGLGLVPEAVARRFLFIANSAPAFAETGQKAKAEQS